jgi:hypothetical protein
MRHRIGVSARAVSLGLDDGTTKTEYGGGGLAVSYRLSRRWELALALDALDASGAPKGAGSPDLHSTTLEARFHLTPHRRWDWYAIAGIGGLHEAPLEGESHDDVASRGQVNLGAGIARRFPRWSIAAELHAVAVGPLESEMETAQKVTTPMATDEGLSGGKLTVAATFFF